MERILVVMESRHGQWFSLARAASLAERIGARVYVLMVFSTGDGAPDLLEQELEASVRDRVELLQRNSNSPGIMELFLARGNYEEEVVRFAEQYKITLLVAESPGDPGPGAREARAMEAVRRRLRCRVEYITPKGPSQMKGNRL